MENAVLAIEWIGTIAFALSGAMMGVRKQMDLFGVNVLGVATAVGGGCLRDVLLGVTPPQMLRNPALACVAIATSTIFFFLLYFHRAEPSERTVRRYERLLLYCDAIGLGVFTVSGMNAALRVCEAPSAFLLLFVGVLTGTGGGMLRDIMAGETPFVLVKHIYACASLAGGLAYWLLMGLLPRTGAMLLGAGATVVIRALASHFRWNLPRIRRGPGAGQAAAERPASPSPADGAIRP